MIRKKQTDRDLLEMYREPVPTVTDRTTELLAPAKSADTGKMSD